MSRRAPAASAANEDIVPAEGAAPLAEWRRYTHRPAAASS